MPTVLISPASFLNGEVHLPADKSISHRYAILGAMSRGTTHISNYAYNLDCQSTLSCLKMLGVRVAQSGSEVEIKSSGWETFRKPSGVLNAGNSGTTIRLVSALLSASPFVSSIQGDQSLNRRPMQRIITPLEAMGARIEASHGQCAPLCITGNRLRGIHFELPISSAQVKSCVLLAGLMGTGRTTVVERVRSRDHTERAIPFFKTTLDRQDHHLSVNGPALLEATNMQVPGDFSAAVFFIAAALLLPDSYITLKKVGINPSRTGLLVLLEEAGARIRRTECQEINGEPVCNLHINFSPAALEQISGEIDGDQIPNLIDEVPVLAILGTHFKNGLLIRNAEDLRKKESDRIDAVLSNLRNLGIQTEEFNDGFHIPPGQKIQGGKVKTFGDHRIAMAFAIAGLFSKNPVELDDSACVAVSFPHFFRELEAISQSG